MKKLILALTILCFFITSVLGKNPVYAQEFRFPAPGVRVGLSPEFDPPILKGIKVHPDDPFRFDFILDQGDEYGRHPARSEGSQQEQLKTESTKLIKYFLASLTIPEKDLWVNLSPYEKDRIIPKSFGLTEMGRDLLAEDYMLKQITASLIYPEETIGKRFWKRIYEEAEKKFGTTNIPVNTFNKVWIIPEKAVVYENAKAGTAYVVEAKLKVMLEQDYLSLSKHLSNSKKTTNNDVNALGSQIVREIVIPELTKEVNEDKNFTQLRQVYNSLILATWYKNKIRNSILEQVYGNKKKVAGIDYKDAINIKAIYQRYLQAFKKGVFNYIKEEITYGPDSREQGILPKKYFSGGASLNKVSEDLQVTTSAAMIGKVPEVEYVEAVKFDEVKRPDNRRVKNVTWTSRLRDEWDKRMNVIQIDYADNPPVLFDPKIIKRRKLGRFIQMMYQVPENQKGALKNAPPDIDKNFAFIKKDARLFDDPFDSQLGVYMNRIPRTDYGALLISNEWAPQKEQERYLRSQMAWARQGAVIEFHRKFRFVHYYHAHIYASGKIPIQQSAKSFNASRQIGDVGLGQLDDYPVPHFVIASQSADSLVKAGILVHQLLYSQDKDFSHDVIFDPVSRNFMMAFFIWKPYKEVIQFNTCGIVRSLDEKLTEKKLIPILQKMFINPDQLSALKEEISDYLAYLLAAGGNGHADEKHLKEGRTSAMEEVLRRLQGPALVKLLSTQLPRAQQLGRRKLDKTLSLNPNPGLTEGLVKGVLPANDVDIEDQAMMEDAKARMELDKEIAGKFAVKMDGRTIEDVGHLRYLVIAEPGVGLVRIYLRRETDNERFWSESIPVFHFKIDLNGNIDEPDISLYETSLKNGRELKGRGLAKQIYQILWDAMSEGAKVKGVIRNPETLDYLREHCKTDGQEILFRETPQARPLRIVEQGAAGEGQITLEDVLSNTLMGHLLRQADFADINFLYKRDYRNNGPVLDGFKALYTFLEQEPVKNLQESQPFLQARKSLTAPAAPAMMVTASGGHGQDVMDFFAPDRGQQWAKWMKSNSRQWTLFAGARAKPRNPKLIIAKVSFPSPLRDVRNNRKKPPEARVKSARHKISARTAQVHQGQLDLADALEHIRNDLRSFLYDNSNFPDTLKQHISETWQNSDLKQKREIELTLENEIDRRYASSHFKIAASLDVVLGDLMGDLEETDYEGRSLEEQMRAVMVQYYEDKIRERFKRKEYRESALESLRGIVGGEFFRPLGGVWPEGKAADVTEIKLWKAAIDAYRTRIKLLGRIRANKTPFGLYIKSVEDALKQLEILQSRNPATASATGGIDLTPANMHVQTQNAGEEIKFHMDPAMLAQLQNAPGFVPVIINIEPLGNLRVFLGLEGNNSIQT